MVQRTKERGDCVEVFKDPDQIVVATTGIHPGNLFSFFLVRFYGGKGWWVIS